jgi:hypothetical protein
MPHSDPKSQKEGTFARAANAIGDLIIMMQITNYRLQSA